MTELMLPLTNVRNADGFPPVIALVVDVDGNEVELDVIVDAVNQHAALVSHVETLQAERDRYLAINQELVKRALPTDTLTDKAVIVRLEAQRDALKAALTTAREALEYVGRVAPGYDWNADPKWLTRVMGDAYTKIDAALALAEGK